MCIRVILLFLVPSSVFAGFENSGRGARPIALSNAFVAIGGSPWSTVYNSAGLAAMRSIEGAAFLIPQQFGLKELRTVGAAAVVPFGVVSAGVVISQFGFDLYREDAIAVGIGRSIDERTAIGGTINVVRISIDRYGSVTIPSYDLGVLVDVVEELRIGFNWKNMTAAKIGRTGEALPQIQCVGLCYELSAATRIAVELEKDLRFPFSVKAGFEQLFLQTLSLRFGAASNPDKFSCGLGVRFGGFEISYAGYTHPQLGWTHQIEIAFTLD